MWEPKSERLTDSADVLARFYDDPATLFAAEDFAEAINRIDQVKVVRAAVPRATLGAAVQAAKTIAFRNQARRN